MENKFPGYCIDCAATVASGHGELTKKNGKFAVSCKLATPEMKAQREAAKVQKAENIEASWQAEVDIDLPVPEGLKYLPYQRAGIASGVRRPRLLLADEMGLGKTIQVVGIINADPTIKRVLVICPASLKLNWARELKKWLVREMQTWIMSGSCGHFEFPITIINYDILAKHVEWLQSVAWDLVVVDEAHYLKSKGAKRSQAVFGIDDYTAKKQKCEPTPGITGRRQIALTGTPIPNRTVEGYGLFHWLAPVEFKNFFGYAKRYCAAAQNGYGWDMSGASNLGELQDKLRGSIMVRRLKQDVLKDLPPKTRQIVEFEANGAAGAVAREADAWEASEQEITRLRVLAELAKAGTDDEYTAAVKALTDATQAAFNEMSVLRHETALATVPYALQHILGALDSDQNHKLVVFAWHKDVIEALSEGINGYENEQDRPEIRKVGGDRRSSESGDWSCRSNVQMPMRIGKTGSGVNTSTGQFRGMPELQASETRSIKNADLSPVDECVNESQEVRSPVHDIDLGHTSSGCVPSSGNSNIFQRQEIQSIQPVAGSDHTECGVYSGKRHSGELAGQCNQTQRQLGGDRNDSEKSSSIVVTLTGDTPMQRRQDNVDAFQRDPNVRVFIGNIQAAGVGITLTAASQVIFAELDWVPGNMTQAEDRCHRIGQHDNVLVQHLVLEGSLSARMSKVLIEKQEIIDLALDRKEELPPEPATPSRERAATESTTRSKLAQIAETLTKEQIEAIHTGLKIIAGYDADYAQEQNGMGYSKMDVAIGHSLAESYSLTPRQAALGQKLVNKYRRQLPAELVAEAKGAVTASAA
jgi:hypothetical protein